MTSEFVTIESVVCDGCHREMINVLEKAFGKRVVFRPSRLKGWLDTVRRHYPLGHADCGGFPMVSTRTATEEEVEQWR